MIYVGIDPGLTGCVAALDAQGAVLLAEALPVIRSGKAAWIDGEAFTHSLRAFAPDACVTVERAQAMPGQGVSSSFQIGLTFGSILASVQSAGLRLELVSPHVWKAAMSVTRDKRATLDRARLLFPGVRLDRVKDHNLGEALLMAEYARRIAGQRVAASG